MKNRFFLLFILWPVFFACNSASKTQSADIIIINAVVWTGDSLLPNATAIALKENKIVYVGDNPDEFSSSTTVTIDAGNRMITPGIIDNHVHFLSGGYQLGSVDLRRANSKAEFVKIFGEYAGSTKAGRWIQGGDWDHEAMAEMPRRDWIDSIDTDNPVLVARYDGHMALANSKALKLAGIDRNTKDPEGGTILRDDSTGEPTGILKDAAMNLVYNVIPAPDSAELDEMFNRAQEHAISLGVTQVTDVNSFGGWTDLETYRRARRKNALKLRVYSLVQLGDWKKLEDYTKRNGKGDDLLFWGGLKGFVDGSLGSTTAWFYDPYLDEPGTSGLIITDTAKLRADIIDANNAGLHVAVHAIGDRAIDWLLDVYETAANEGKKRFRIEHAQHISKSSVARFKSLKVIASVQPYHAIDDGRWAAKRLDNDRLLRTYAFRTLLDAGATVTFGSDWTVAPLNPMEGIFAATFRQTLDGQNPGGWFPAEKLTVEESLQCYTVNNAFANFMEDKTGSLKAGKLADLVIWDTNILNASADQIRNAKAWMTFIDGKKVFTQER